MRNSGTYAYKNPVIPGFFPDPSVARVGEDYYLVTSSFEYFPGVPIFHSKNLVNWKQIGHVLTRRGQIDLRHRKSSDGIYAPTLRYNEGTYYLVTTDVRGIGNFYVTAQHPEGPWSDPVTLPYGGIDPSLMFDDDGRVFVTVQSGQDLQSHIIQYEIDPVSGKVLTEPRRIWEGDGGVWTEGPHLYKINGMYYLLSACGGTGRDHRAIIGRSAHPYGPFEACPVPVLTHNRLPEDPIQCLGHADLFEDANGCWWAVFLGTRPVRGRYSVLGRETFLAPVTWTRDGWPMIDNNEGAVLEQMPPVQLPASAEDLTESRKQAIELHSEFDPYWSFLRVYDEERYQIGRKSGEVELTGNAFSLDDEAPATFACVRQTSRFIRFSCRIEYEPLIDGEEAGIAARLHNHAYVILSIKRFQDSNYVCVTVRNGDKKYEDKIPWNGKHCYLSVQSDDSAYYCSFSEDGLTWMEKPGVIEAEWLAPEVNGGFTGVCIGLYASGNGSSATVKSCFSVVQYKSLV
ncbi:glycoside hydrolase family 43 protein [Paenibacillus tarimensis]